MSLSLCSLIAIRNDLCTEVLLPIPIQVRIVLGSEYVFVLQGLVHCWLALPLSGALDPDTTQEESWVSTLLVPNRCSFGMCLRTLLVSNEPKKGA